MYSFIRQKTAALATTVTGVVGMAEDTDELTPQPQTISAAPERELTHRERLEKILNKKRIKDNDRLFLLSYAGNTPRQAAGRVAGEHHGES